MTIDSVAIVIGIACSNWVRCANNVAMDDAATLARASSTRLAPSQLSGLERSASRAFAVRLPALAAARILYRLADNMATSVPEENAISSNRTTSATPSMEEGAF